LVFAIQLDRTKTSKISTLMGYFINKYNKICIKIYQRCTNVQQNVSKK